MQVQDGSGRIPSCPDWCTGEHHRPSDPNQLHESQYRGPTFTAGARFSRAWSAVESFETDGDVRAPELFVSSYDTKTDRRNPRVYVKDARAARGWAQIIRTLGGMPQADHEALASAIEQAAALIEPEAG